MTNVVALRGEVGEVLPVGAVALPDLAKRATVEHEAVEHHLGAALDHAIAAGEALLQAQAQVPTGSWLAWLDANFPGSQVTAYYYMRIAHYRELVRELPSVSAAMSRLRGMPAIRSAGWHSYDEQLRDASVRLYQDGMRVPDIARTWGVSGDTVRSWVDPAWRRRKQRELARRREAAKLLRDRERRESIDRLMRRQGGAVGNAYSHVRRALNQLDRARPRAQVERDAVRAAMSALHQAEDALVAASRRG